MWITYIYIILFYIEFHHICVADICPFCKNKFFENSNIERHPELLISINKKEDSEDDLSLSDSDDEILNGSDSSDVEIIGEIENPSESYLHDKYFLFNYFVS